MRPDMDYWFLVFSFSCTSHVFFVIYGSNNFLRDSESMFEFMNLNHNSEQQQEQFFI